MNNRQRKLLVYLQEHPVWHYGLDLVKAGVHGRTLIYVRLSQLEDMGYVERREVDAVDHLGRRFIGKRVQFRATGKRLEDPVTDDEMVPA